MVAATFCNNNGSIWTAYCRYKWERISSIYLYNILKRIHLVDSFKTITVICTVFNQILGRVLGNHSLIGW